jgi:nitroimidazol reductase NimA-like FMN-containing flavoprotein (pyridoxamine 5'-phosphate oxidase superfamily)
LEGSAVSEPQVPEESMTRAVLEQVDEAECLRLIGAGGIGRIAYTGKYGLTVLPVNYKVHNGAILFRTSADSLTASELRTGLEGSEYRVAFEVDDFSPVSRDGWSVLVQGPAHHLDDETERGEALAAGVEAWPGGEHDQFIKIRPMRVTGRRIRRVGP